jgi:hypothetical protein
MVHTQHRTCEQQYQIVELPERDRSVDEHLKPLSGEEVYQHVFGKTDKGVEFGTRNKRFTKE